MRAGAGGSAGRARAPRLGGYLPRALPALPQPSFLPGPSAAARLLRCEGDRATPAFRQKPGALRLPLPSPNLRKREEAPYAPCGHARFLGRRGLTEGILFCLVLKWLIKEKKKSQLAVHFLQIFWTLSKVIFGGAYQYTQEHRTVRDLILLAVQGTHSAPLWIEHAAG